MESLKSLNSQKSALETSEIVTSGKRRNMKNVKVNFCLCNNPQNPSLSVNCAECKKTFHRKCIKMPLQEYRDLEENKREWMCTNCSDQVRTSENYNEDDRIMCPACPRDFGSNQGLSAHIRHSHPQLYRSHLAKPTSSVSDDTEKKLLDFLILIRNYYD